jgi:hypothetical protein
MKPCYAGIGSRRISASETATISSLASSLKDRFTLYSGHAEGADQAFESGAGEESVVWLPFESFCTEVPIYGKSYVMGNSPAGIQSAMRFHPRGKMLHLGARAMMSRNHHQIFGLPPGHPKVSFVVCCAIQGCDDETRDFLLSRFGEVDGRKMVESSVHGGTGQAVRAASYFDIPVVNIRTEGWREKLQAIIKEVGP